MEFIGIRFLATQTSNFYNVFTSCMGAEFRAYNTWMPRMSPEEEDQTTVKSPFLFSRPGRREHQLQHRIRKHGPKSQFPKIFPKRHKCMHTKSLQSCPTL